MPAGKELINRVEFHLDPKAGMTMLQIREAVAAGRCTPRAIRYAVSELIKAGRAVKRGTLFFRLEAT